MAAASDRSSSINPYSEERCDDLESFDYPMPSATTSNNSDYPMQSLGCSSNIIHGSPLNNINSGPSDTRWMQYLSDEAFGFQNPSFPNPETMSYPPSTVIIEEILKNYVLQRPNSSYLTSTFLWCSIS